MDHNIGRLVDLLDDLGVTENTLIVFVSDNGACTMGDDTAGNYPGNNGPFRGGKATTYQGGDGCSSRWRVNIALFPANNLYHVPAGAAMTARRYRRPIVQFRLATFLLLVTIAGLLLAAFGPAVYRFAQAIGVGPIAFFALLLGFPSVLIAFCFGDMFAFLRNPRIVRDRRLPDSVEIDDSVCQSPATASRKPRKTPRIVNRSTWFHTRWIGPGGYR